MSAEWTSIKAAFQAVVDLDPAAQRAWLDQHCTDPDVRAEVDSLLACDRTPHDAIEDVAEMAGPVTDEPSMAPGQMVGPYRIDRELGHGGMGTVYLATRADGAYDQQVAVKIVRRGMDTAEIRERFRHERQTLADLQHPNIATLVDGGTTDDGLPYLVMEYVVGEPIDRFCDARKLSIDDRLRLFIRVCMAVAHAHSRLVVHRDLKPDNILVSAAAEPKLLDFGIAKLLPPPGTTGSTALTRTSVRPMTLRYASPEQVRGESVGTSTDVYALGVLLYELLSGRYPYERALRRRSGTELESAIRDTDPRAPSHLLSGRSAAGPEDGPARTERTPEQIARDRSTTPAGLQRQLRGDLDTIVLRAMHKEQARRYPSVEQLAADVERHLSGRPVLARKDTFGYRSAKFVRRHRLGVAAATIAVLSLVGGLTGAVWQARAAAIERDRARAETRKADQISQFLQQAFGFADPSWFGTPNTKGRDAKVMDLLASASQRLEHELGDAPEIRATLHRTIGITYRSLADYKEADRHLRLALDLFRRVRGEHDIETATTLCEFGSLLVLEGKLPEAERTLRSSLALRRELMKTPDIKFSGNLSDLATAILQQRSDVKEAEALYLESLSIYRALLDKNHPAIANLLNNLAVMYNGAGDPEKAEPVLREAIAIFERLPVPPYEYGTALSNLSYLCRISGRTTEAEQHVRRAIVVFRSAVGDANPYLAGATTELADVLCAEGRYREAEEQEREALAMLEKLGLTRHYLSVRGTTSLGRILVRAGRLREAETLVRATLEIAKSIQNARAVALAQGQLGECLTAEGRYAEAEPLLLASEATFRERYGEKHTTVREAKDRLQKLYQLWKPPGQETTARTPDPSSTGR